MKKLLNSKIRKAKHSITYNDVYDRLSEIDVLIPNAEKVIPKLQEYFDWARENYHRMDRYAKQAVRSESHMEVELIFSQALKTFQNA